MRLRFLILGFLIGILIISGCSVKEDEMPYKLESEEGIKSVSLEHPVNINNEINVITNKIFLLKFIILILFSSI
ncbi:MAG: hypothetical protein US35_C0033G0006 [Parcubacteria group bacterium GW2011_GWA2_37_10]|nr:MAG: hypothetical protein US35_C0033G0006 [Parcubacteria group bacterium GW2011_GWA2_37_10]